MKNFLYVKDSETKDKLIGLGYTLLQQTSTGVWVFVNQTNPPAQFFELGLDKVIDTNSLEF